MNIFLLYQSADPVAPLLRSANELAKLGVLLTTRQTDDYEIVRGRRDWPFDLIIAENKPLRRDHLPLGVPLILFERADGAQLGVARKFLEYDEVLGLIKQYAFRAPELHNEVCGRYHSHVLLSKGICGRFRANVPSRHIPLTASQLAKIHIIHGFGAYPYMERLVSNEVDFAAEREIDLHLACNLDYRDTEIEAHRRLAVSATSRWHVNGTGCAFPVPHQSLPRDRYWSTIQHAKAVLSPWGWGEACFRDYEAFHLGAILIKPDSDHVASECDLYRSGETYVACRPDFADLPEIMAGIITHWDRYLDMRRRCKELAVRAWQPQFIAQSFVQVLRSCWSQAGQAWPDGETTTPQDLQPMVSTRYMNT